MRVVGETVGQIGKHPHVDGAWRAGFRAERRAPAFGVRGIGRAHRDLVSPKGQLPRQRRGDARNTTVTPGVLEVRGDVKYTERHSCGKYDTESPGDQNCKRYPILRLRRSPLDALPSASEASPAPEHEPSTLLVVGRPGRSLFRADLRQCPEQPLHLRRRPDDPGKHVARRPPRLQAHRPPRVDAAPGERLLRARSSHLALAARGAPPDQCPAARAERAAGLSAGLERRRRPAVARAPGACRTRLAAGGGLHGSLPVRPAPDDDRGRGLHQRQVGGAVCLLLPARPAVGAAVDDRRGREVDGPRDGVMGGGADVEGSGRLLADRRVDVRPLSCSAVPMSSGVAASGASTCRCWR